MSLDLYIKATKPVRHRGTGVFVREDGVQRELKTVKEVELFFPDEDLSNVKEYDYQDDTWLHINLTHNLTEMASHIPIEGTEGVMTQPLSAYNLLWNPETNPLLKNERLHRKDEFGKCEWYLNITWLSHEYIRQLMAVYMYIDTHREELEQYNPENGWGSYEQLRNATHKLLRALLDIQNEQKLSEYFIYCWN